MSRHGFGIIAMAAFQPDPDLFRQQLQSIQTQTYTDFLCLISADGGASEVSRLVAESTGGDPRFRVLGHNERLGFYLNFERVLLAVPRDATWVALSDQDDSWYPHKLQTLLPQLQRHALVTGQARVVNAEDGAVMLAKTPRKVVPFADLLIQNQVTGAQSVFRRELLDLALPFPRLHTMTQTHDHWLAVCAAATDGYSVLDEPLQDYVQHGANVIGEISLVHARAQGLLRRLRRMFELHGEYGEGGSLFGVWRTCNALSFGWRRTLVNCIADRQPTISDELAAARNAFGDRHSNLAAARYLVARLRSGNVEGVVLATFVPGLPSEALRPLREPRQRSAPLERVN